MRIVLVDFLILRQSAIRLTFMKKPLRRCSCRPNCCVQIGHEGHKWTGELSAELKHFVANADWIFAKTYAATWPHEYIVDEGVDGVSFQTLANHIDTYGYESVFYRTKQIYYDYDGNTYWHMENIINRCPAVKPIASERRRAGCPKTGKREGVTGEQERVLA